MNNNDPFQPIKDSSVWVNNSDWRAVKKDPFVRIGIVKKASIEKESKETIYLVEIRDKTDKIYASCRMMAKFGGAYNYEDIINRGYTSIPGISLEPDSLDTRAGDTVVVAFLNGETRYGVILGGLNHPARKSKLTDDSGPQYKAEFNGVETFINSDGEYKVTVKGQPLNVALLNAPPSIAVIDPIYNPAIGGTYMEFDKLGGWELSDDNTVLPQYIKLKKTPGTLEMVSGTVSLLLDKTQMSISTMSTKFTIDSQLSISCNTTTFSVNAKLAIKLKGLKVAIGNDAVELLDLLAQLIDNLGNVAPISPIGPCTPLQITPGWIAVSLTKAKLKSITGSL